MIKRARPRKPVAAAKPAVRVVVDGKQNEAVLDPIITMNGGGVIQSASDSIEQVFGWTPTELFGRNVKMLIPEPRRSALDRFLDRYRNGDATKTLQRSRRFDALRKDGTGLQIELSVSRADLPVSAEPFFIGIIRDVGQQIDIGPDSAEERERLTRLIVEQTRALATANLRLQLADRLASLGTLVAGLGHDMNNVLLPVRARLDALEHAGINSAARDHVTAVRRSIGYLQHLSDGLHFLAIDPDGPDSRVGEEGTTDLVRWWGQVGTLLQKAIPQNVKLRASLPDRLPVVKIAQHWLTQAMLNLIVNAGESMPKARRAAQVMIWAKKSDDGRMVKLGVTDNGRGMSQAIQRRAFDLFFTTKSRGMGTGLGLPLARKVAARAGGDVQITSAPGKGTTVTLSLPAMSRGDARAGLGGTEGRSAMISVRDLRTAALISHVILKAGLKLRPAENGGPGKSDLWITEPSPRALAAAVRWRKDRVSRSIVLLGRPAGSSQKRWKALGAWVIDPVDDFLAIRRTLAQALVGK